MIDYPSVMCALPNQSQLVGVLYPSKSEIFDEERERKTTIAKIHMLETPELKHST